MAKETIRRFCILVGTEIGKLSKIHATYILYFWSKVYLSSSMKTTKLVILLLGSFRLINTWCVLTHDCPLEPVLKSITFGSSLRKHIISTQDFFSHIKLKWIFFCFMSNKFLPIGWKMFSLVVPAAAIRCIVDQKLHLADKICFCTPDIVEPRKLWHYH